MSGPLVSAGVVCSLASPGACRSRGLTQFEGKASTFDPVSHTGRQGREIASDGAGRSGGTAICSRREATSG